MATSTQLNQIYQYCVGLFKAAPGGYMDGLVDFVELGYSTQEMALALANSPVFKGLYNTDSDEAFVTAYLTNLMGTTLEGKSVEIDGADVSVFDFTKDYALEMLQTQSRAQVAVALVDALAQLEGNEYYGDAYDLMMSRVDLAKGYQILGGESTNIATLQSVLGAFASSYDLTTGLDNLLGGMGNDTFVANIVGTLSTLQNGDKIDGGAGSDTLFAHINPNGLVVSAETSNVETVKFRVQADQFDSGDNNIAGVGIIDAERMVGVTTWEDNNSRADLVIEDVRILDNQITKDITIEMRDTDPGHVDFGVYFDQLSLRSVSSSDAQINLRVMDTYAVAQGLDELKDSPYGSFTFWYSLEGSDFAKVSLASEDIQNAQTYDEMRDALQAAANSVFGPGVVTVSLGSTYTVPDSVTGTDVTGTEIVLAASGNIAFDTTMAGSGWLATDTVPAISGLYTSYNTASSSSTDLVTSTIVLDNVGRGSVGGDLVVGGLSVGDTSTSKGVQQFDITVEDSSKLQTISSTNNTLQVVNIVNGVADESAYAYGDPSEGNLTVNGVVGLATGINAALPGSTAAAGDFGFTDVRVIDGSAMTGKLEFTAEFSADSIAKYLDLEDTQAAPAGDNIAVAYDGGANDDTMLIEIDAQAAASRSTIVSGREDFTFSFDGNAGDDTIVVTVDDALARVGGVEDWYYNQNLNNNISISGGAGDDTIWTPGAGDMTIDAGSGDDAVYTDNTGAQAAGGLAIDVVDKGAWLFNTAAQTAAVADAAAFRDLDDLRSDVNDSYNLYKATLTVTFKGIASDVITLANTATYKTTDLEINQAIKNAINNDDVLSKLLVAQDGPANSLIVKSLIDGVMTTGDLTVALAAPTAELNSTELTAVNTAWGTAYANSAAALAGEVAVVTAFNTKADYVDVLATDGTVTERTGADSTNVSDNFVTPGTGNDVIVLGTTLGAGVATSSNEVVVYNSAAFGDDVIVNFDVAGNGIDHLSFNGILGGAVSGLYGAENITNRSVTIVAETAANDSADEIKALYNAIDDATASSHLYIAYNAHNVGSVYYVVDGTGADDVTVTKYGTIDLADTAWNTITLANLTVPSVYAEGPVAAQGAILVAPAGAAALNGTAFADILDGTLGAAGIAITGLAGNDTITGATLGAVIDGGLGADAIDLTVNGVTDTVVITAGPDTIANFLVGGGAGADDLQIDISNIEDLVVGSDYVATDGSSVVAGAVSIQTIAGAAVIGGAADEVLFVNGDIADAAALETALEVGGGFAVTTTNAIAALDTLLVAFDNGTNSYIAAVTSTAGAAGGATFAAGDLTATVLVQLTGVADVTTLLAGDFAAAIA